MLLLLVNKCKIGERLSLAQAIIIAFISSRDYFIRRQYKGELLYGTQQIFLLFVLQVAYFLKKNPMRFKQLFVVFITVLSLFGVYWINTGKTSLKTTGEVAGREEVINYTLPPGFIFSIWGLIYLGFLIYAFYGLKKGAASDPQLNKTAYPVALSIFLNFVWTVIVGAELWIWAYPLQWAMLVIAIIILYRWDLNKQTLTRTQKYLSIPFALYAGWLTVAMIPFTADLLNRTEWNYEPFSQTTWALILYFLAFLIVLLAFRSLKQPFFLLPLAWAFYGFFIRFEDALKFTAMGLGILLLIYFIIQLQRFYRQKQ